ncbi:MAG TPA: 2-C-methyl-D-erythritol 4-phosphate cytidylyltransferase, partial [Pyrinomonadaceae bacterium]
DTPKQFLELKGKPVVEHALERFDAARSVDAIVLVLSADRLRQFDERSFGKIANIVVGGETRAESVKNGLAAVSDDMDIVTVHDGARPLVTVEEIERTIEAARRTGAACLVAPVTDTIKAIQGNEIASTLDRSKLRRAVTPQAFRLDVLRKAFEGVDLNDSITDECYLVERLGHPIEIVEGSAHNIKITHTEDLAIAEALLGFDS